MNGTSATQFNLGGNDLPEEVLVVFAGLNGFNLVAWDKWLATLERCPSKAELMERRQKAKRATTTDAKLRHLEWMQRRRFEIEREDSLLRLARTGDKVRRPRERSNDKRKQDADALHATWQKHADALWAQPQHATKSTSAIARLIDPARFGTVRNNIRKPKK